MDAPEHRVWVIDPDEPEGSMQELHLEPHPDL